MTEFRFEFSFPASVAPAWQDRVERWYSLDAPAYGLAELFWREQEHLTERPGTLFLASSGASNRTDASFARTRPPSPAKFVHTLPNTRAAALLRLMDWNGPTYCLQNDPATLETALSEGRSVVEITSLPVWVASVENIAADRYRARIFTLKPVAGKS